MTDHIQVKILGEDKHTRNGQDIFKPEGQTPIVDRNITQKEDADLKLHQSQLIPEDSNLPNRPGFAQNGRSVILRANFFELRLADGRQIFPYKVDVDQRLQISKRQLKDFVRTILRRLPELKPVGHGVATDYISLLVTSAKIDLGPTDKKTYEIPYYEREGLESKVYAGVKPFALTLTLLQPISAADLSRYIGSTPSVFGGSQGAGSEIIRALNIIVTGHAHKDHSVYQGGQNTFFRYPSSQDTASNFDLQGGLIAIRGYFYSVRFATLRVLLNIHGQCNPFYKAINACTLMQECQNLGEKSQALDGFFRMLRVMTSYTKGTNGNFVTKIKTIIGLSPKDAHNTMFKLTRDQSEVTVSVAQYFDTEYGLKLEYPEKQVFNCGTTTKPVWIPAELCTVMPGQRYIGDLQKDQTTRMLIIAARPPGENAKRIVAEDGGLGMIGVLPQRCPTLTAFGIMINSKMVVVPGRVLDSPRLKYAGSSIISPRNGAWNMSGKTFLKPALMPSWTLLRIGAAAKIDLSALEAMFNVLTNVFKTHGLKGVMPKNYPGPTVDLPQAADEKSSIDRSAVDGALENVFKENKQKGIGMFLVILPSEDPWLFDRIKYWGDVAFGMHTSCMQMSKMRKANVNIAANVSLKVNLKLGGTNQYLNPADLGFLHHGNTMVVGIDVTHPRPGSIKGTPSIAGVVASIDAHFTQWPGSIRCQTSRKEMVSALDVLIEERLRLWISTNQNHKLENIMVYRDGVSESQYETVLLEEIPAIRKACTKVLDGNLQPKITCIVAVKRHHTRLFPTDTKGADPSHRNNIKNGTVVDRNITIPRKWDFFMAPHVALQGTTKPAHYVVILDEIKDTKKLGANHLEQITHNLCYLHGTTTSAVSLCPPAYYADKICERGRCYIADYINSKKPTDEFEYNETPWHQGVHESIKDSMFYI